MRSLKPEFINALDDFVAEVSSADDVERWFIRRRIVVELEYQANSISSRAGQLVFFQDQTSSTMFTCGYRYEAEIDGEPYSIIAKQEDFTGKKCGPIITTPMDL